MADEGDLAQDMHDWAAQVSMPPLSEIPEGLLDRTPNFSDHRLNQLTFPPIHDPLALAWPPKPPRQPPLPPELSPRRAPDVMPHEVWRRVERWLLRTLKDLVCIRDEGAACERRRAGVGAGNCGGGDLHPWARGVV